MSKSIVLRYSIIGTIILCVLGVFNWLFIAKPLGYQASEIVGYLSMVIALSVIYFAIRRYRETSGEGALSFGKGFQIGILISLTTSAFFFLYSIVYFKVWGDDFRTWAEGHFQATMSDQEYQAYLEQVEQMGSLYTNVVFQGFVMFMTVFFIGLIITLISALLLKTRSSSARISAS